MTTRYPSAIDGWLIIVLGIAALISLYACWVVIRTGESMALIVLPAIALGIALPLWILLGTHYTLSPTHLEVRCGPAKTTIPIDRIKEVRAVRSLLASSALSIDRLEIRYEPHGVIMVSPRERERFLEQLGSFGVRSHSNP